MEESFKDIFNAFQGKIKEEKSKKTPSKKIEIFNARDIHLLKELPEDLKKLYIIGVEIEELPKLPKSLKSLRCIECKLTKLPDLPEELKNLYCSVNNLEELPELPNTLKKLYCVNNKLKKLPKLPNSLEELNCSNNEIEELPQLPKNLKILQCSHNKLKSIPKIPENLTSLFCNKNELEFLPNLKNVRNLNAAFNKIKSIPKFGNSLFRLVLNDNQITKIPNYVKNKHNNLIILIYNNPIADKIYHIGHPDLDLIQYREYNGEKFPVITFRKGTVLFRNYHDLALVAEDYIGKVKKSFLWEDKYYLSPDHLVWYSLSPFDNIFGQVKSINVLQQDVTLILGLLPSEIKGTDIIFYGETNFQTECINKKYKRKVDQGEYACFKDDFIEQNPDILGSFQNFPGDDRKPFKVKNKFALDYETFYEDHSKYVNIPEIVLYPRKIRDKEDRIVKKKNFNDEWFEKHIDEYNVKPLHIFNNKTYDDLGKYKTIMDQFLSPEGFKVDDVSYHMTINKKTRDFVIAEFANPELLELCLPITDKDKEKFLKQ